MTPEEQKRERERLYRKLRGAMFEYYLWSLPVDTPPEDVSALAEGASIHAEQILHEYKEATP